MAMLGKNATNQNPEKNFTMKHRGFRKYPENNVPVRDCQQKLLSR